MLWHYNNVALLMTAAAVSSVAWLFGGARGDWLNPVAPWLVLMMVETVFFFPQRYPGETSSVARTRVWTELRRSPAVLLSGALLLLLAIPFANNGLCPRCDAALIAQGAKAAPPFQFLPFCVDRLAHLNVFLWFAVALSVAMSVRYGLTREGKRKLVELVVWNGVALAILGLGQVAADAQGPFGVAIASGVHLNARQFFSSFGYVNHAGDYFTVLFGLTLALWYDRYERICRDESAKSLSERSGDDARRYGQFGRRHFFLIPAAIFFFAAMNTLSRAAIVFSTALAVICFLHALMVITSRLPRHHRASRVFWSVLVFSLIVFFAAVFMPASMRKEMSTIETISTLDRFTGRDERQSRIATDLFKTYPAFGCGGWGYVHFYRRFMTPDERKVRYVAPGTANVHNDYLQFLAEHGVIGFGLLLAIVIAYFWPVGGQWRLMARSLRFAKHGLPPKPRRLFVFPGGAFFAVLSLVVTCLHACLDCPLRSCAVLTLFFSVLAALPGFLPAFDDEEGRTAVRPMHHAHDHHHHHHHHHSES